MASTQTKIKSTLNLALDYLALNPGRYLFPIKRHAKSPPLVADNLDIASDDPAQITAWHEKWPGCSWGLALRMSHIIVADVDQKPGKVGAATYDELNLLYGWPETETVRSPSGGLHHYYSGEHVFALGKHGFGVDIDSPNYVLIPGCTLADGTAYEAIDDTEIAAAPEWFGEFLKLHERTEAQTVGVVEWDQDANVNWALGYLINDAPNAIEGKGGEKTTMGIAQQLRDHGISEHKCFELMADEYNKEGKCIPIWSTAELKKKISNAYTYSSLRAPGEATAEADFHDDPVPVIAVSPAAKIEIAARKAMPKENATIAQLCEDWVWVVGQKRFVRRLDGVLWDREMFDSMFNSVVRGPSISKEMFKAKRSIRKPESLVFRPGQKEFDGDLYNTWRPSDIVPEQGDTSLWRAHFELLFPDPADRKLVLDWLAWVYQHQDLKPNHALLLVGELHGTGKSFIARVFARLIGLPNTKRPKNSSLKGDFNGWAVQCKLAIIEELMQIGRREVANELRDIITEPGIEVNIKNVPAFEIENYMAMLAITNHPDAMPLEESDRRWLVVKTLLETKPPAAYYARLFSVLLGPDAPKLLNAIAWELKHRDLGKYDGRSDAPVTGAKHEMIGSARTGVEYYMVEEADNPPLTWKLVRIADVIDILPDHERRGSGRTVEMAVARVLQKKFGGVNLGTHWIDRRNVKLWAINGSAAELRNLQPLERAAIYNAQRRVSSQAAPPIDDFAEGSDNDNAVEADPLADIM